MVLEDELYFTIDSLETQLRSCFDYEEMWEIPEGYEIKIKNKTILVDKFTGLVLSVEET